MTSQCPAKLVVSRKKCLKSSSIRHLYKSIGPDGQQHHEDGVEKQEQAFKRMKMVVQDKI
eukprot:4102465-Ditylum_brightwellii.AAC.1